MTALPATTDTLHATVPDFRFADDLGPARIVHLYELSLGLQAVVVVDNVAIGPAIGGVRMAPDVSTEEAFRLARAMTLKNAMAGLRHGGGKAVLFGDPRMPVESKQRLVRAFAQAIAPLTEYIPGPDMGTDETAMAWIHDEIGRVVGLPRELGGIPLDQIGATGWGLFHAVQEALSFADFPLEGARVVIQGFGAVGTHAARYLTEHGAVLVGVADIEGAVHDPAGLDVARLLALHAEGQSVTAYPGGRKGPSSAVLDLPCELWIPAARPDVVTLRNVHRLRTRMVVEGANVPLTDDAERKLHEQGVLVLPDFVVNAGGVIAGAVEYRGGEVDEAFDLIATRIRQNIRQVLEQSVARGTPPREAALELARTRVLRAMSFGRWATSGA